MKTATAVAIFPVTSGTARVSPSLFNVRMVASMLPIPVTLAYQTRSRREALRFGASQPQARAGFGALLPTTKTVSTPALAGPAVQGRGAPKAYCRRQCA